MKRISIITVNFNQPLVTEALLASIAHKCTYPNLEVIVVDNGSSNNPVPSWESRYDKVIFIRSAENLGFAGGNNLGIERATGDYFFLVNNDTEFTENLVEELLTRIESNPLIGMISPKIHYYDQPGMLQYAGYTFMNYFTASNACIGQFEMDHGQYDHVTGKTGYAHGAAMMVSRQVVDKAGLMAENYFLYYEELDWCDRIKRAGYEIHVDMQALILHKESVSVGKNTALKEYFMNRNRILFVRKNANLGVFLVFCVYFGLAVVPRNLLKYVREKQFNFIPVFLKAIGWHFSHSKDSPELGYVLKS
jgi:GT2 family glycosyltransferase